MTDDFELNNRELLQLHQLKTADYWHSKQLTRKTEETNQSATRKKMPSKWRMTRGVELYSWQRECLEKYAGSGIANVVTGAGKTLFALALMEKLQSAHKDLKVIIIVPTIVLMDQWFDVIKRHGNLPDYAVGRLGGGYKDSLEDCDILIGVCNSVSAVAVDIGSRYQDCLLFIADECHRYRGEVMRKVFDIRRKYSLGLSATPEVENSKNAAPDETDGIDETDPLPERDEVLTRELGEIFFSLNYDDAVRAGFLPEFEIRHVGLPLNSDESNIYRRLSDEITNLRDRLFTIFPDAPRGGELSGWVGMKLNRGKLGEDASAACAQYIGKVADRKTLLYHAASREAAVVRFLRQHLKKDRKTQVIMFHERIDEVMHLYNILVKNNISAVAEHSELSDSLRGDSISLFRRGIARVIVSGKALIEGFDAPAADCGINAASSGSRTQAIQSIGRILRKSGEGQTGLIIRFYIRGTTDENIYRKMDFSELTGAKRNRYFYWDPLDEKAEIFDDEHQAAPFSPLPTEAELNWDDIKPGAHLEFDADGRDFQLDNRDNLYCRVGSEKKFVENPQSLLECLKPFRDVMRNNYLRQTSSNRVFIRRSGDEDRWYWIYCGKIAQQFRIRENSPVVEEFKLVLFHGQRKVQQAKPINGVARNIPEPHAQRILEAVDTLPPEISRGLKKLYIADGKRVFCRVSNTEYPVCDLDAPWNTKSE